VTDENPLLKQKSIESIVGSCIQLLENETTEIEDVLISACYQSKAQTIDECINDIDSMLHAQRKFLNRDERNMLDGTLHNLRGLLSARREALIAKYDRDDNEFDSSE
jgi:hypothetical protein